MDNRMNARTGLYCGEPFTLIRETPMFYIIRFMDGSELTVLKTNSMVVFDKIPATNEPTVITWEEAIWRYADDREVFCVLGNHVYDLLYLMENRNLFKVALEDGVWFLED